MFIIIGFVIVFASILIGYTMHGGKVAALMQINEFIIIGGAGLGSILIGYSLKGAMEVASTCRACPRNSGKLEISRWLDSAQFC